MTILWLSVQGFFMLHRWLCWFRYWMEICSFPPIFPPFRLPNSPLFNTVRYYQVNRKTSTPIPSPKGKNFCSRNKFYSFDLSNLICLNVGLAILLACHSKCHVNNITLTPKIRYSYSSSPPPSPKSTRLMHYPLYSIQRLRDTQTYIWIYSYYIWIYSYNFYKTICVISWYK